MRSWGCCLKARWALELPSLQQLPHVLGEDPLPLTPGVALRRWVGVYSDGSECPVPLFSSLVSNRLSTYNYLKRSHKKSSDTSSRNQPRCFRIQISPEVWVSPCFVIAI